MIDPTELPVIDSQAEPLKIFEELKANNCRRCEQRHKFWEKRGNRQMRKTTHGERRKFRKLGRGNEDRDREARELLHLDQAYIITPASTECRACGALWSLAEGILEAYGIAYSNDISLEWLATRSQLLVKGPSKSQARLFQAFIPRGETA